MSTFGVRAGKHWVQSAPAIGHHVALARFGMSVDAAEKNLSIHVDNLYMFLGVLEYLKWALVCCHDISCLSLLALEWYTSSSSALRLCYIYLNTEMVQQSQSKLRSDGIKILIKIPTYFPMNLFNVGNSIRRLNKEQA